MIARTNNIYYNILVEKKFNLGHIKLLSIDLDGTLLTKFKKITKKDLQALKLFSDLGGHIFINTGKSLVSSLRYIDRISNYINKKLHLYSCLNGNIVFDNIKQKIIHSSLINKSTCSEIYYVCTKNKLGFYPYVQKNEDIRKKANFFAIAFKKYIAHLKYDKLKKFDPIEAYKVNVFKIWKQIKSKETIKELNDINGIQVLETHPKMFEIVKNGSNKASSLKIASELLKIKPDEIAAIGDSANDVPMFEFAGESYLVKEKFSWLKSVVNISFNAKKNGVSKVIYDYILKSNNNLE